MVYTKSKDDDTVSRLTITDRHDIYDKANEDFSRALREILRFQPQYLQSISNLQLDCIQTVKNMIQNTTYAQKQMVESNSGNSWNILPLSSALLPYIEQFTRQLNEFTNNIIRVSNINNEFTITILDTIRENLNIYNRATDEFSKYNTIMTKTWNSFFAMAQQPQQWFFV